MIRERTACGKRGNVTKIWAASSSVADLRASPTCGRVATCQLDWLTDEVLTSTFTSLEIVELSFALLSWIALRPPCVAMRKSYLGLPQFWPFHPSGIPVLPSVCLAQSSTGTVGGSAARSGPAIRETARSAAVVGNTSQRIMTASVSHAPPVLR